MIWWSTLVSSYQALPLPLTGGCNLMDLVVWSHQSSMVMWVAPRQWLSSGHPLLRAWPNAPWRECSLALSLFSTGPLSEMISLGTNSTPIEKNNTLIRINPIVISNMVLTKPIYRSETTYQIALAIKDEVEDLEKAGITVIQIDEAALREGLPLRKSEQANYLDWAVHGFRITNVGVQDTTQVLLHYNNKRVGMKLFFICIYIKK